MRKLYLFVLLSMMLCIGCQWQLQPSDEESEAGEVVIERFDRAERLYLATGDFAALQQMKTLYPVETRTLIEDVLRLGRVDEPDINLRFLYFFQDSTLQELMLDVEEQYHDLSDLDKEFTEAFERLHELLPDLDIPRVYTQIGSLDQSIVVGDSLVGISLDKYLGSDHPVYVRYGYSEEQRAMMTRRYIVPDCLSFYLLRHYPMTISEHDSMALHSDHMARIQYVVNRVMRQQFFNRPQVNEIDKYMRSHPRTALSDLLSAKNYQ